MAKRVTLLLATAAVLLSVVVETSTSNLHFSSIQFTRDTLMGFSRGSERTVEILTPVTKTITNMTDATKENIIFTLHKAKTYAWGRTVTVVEKGLSLVGSSGFDRATTTVSPTKNASTTEKPILQKVIAFAKESKTYRPRNSPSNKFLKVVNEIEKAVINARASGVRYRAATLTKLKELIEKAIIKRSYKYGREVLGQIMYFLSTKQSSPGRMKRAIRNEGNSFLRGLRQRVNSSTFDSFMAVQGDVSLMFVIDDTGSMRNEIQAAKKLAIDIINRTRLAPVEYILSPFNDPIPGKSKINLISQVSFRTLFRFYYTQP